MAAPQMRWHDEQRDRLVTASPNLMMVWRGNKPVEPIAGPWPLSPVPKTVEDLVQAYQDWIAQGEPA